MQNRLTGMAPESWYFLRKEVLLIETVAGDAGGTSSKFIVDLEVLGA